MRLRFDMVGAALGLHLLAAFAFWWNSHVEHSPLREPPSLKVALLSAPAETASAPAPAPAPKPLKPQVTEPVQRAAPIERPKIDRSEPTPAPPQALAAPPAASAPAVAVQPPAASAPAVAAPSPTASAPVKTSVTIDASYAASNPKPPYPSLARRLGEEGTVVLRIFVASDGSADKVEIKKSSGSAILDQSASETIRRWRFNPAKVDGKPVAEWYETRWTFKLEN